MAKDRANTNTALRSEQVWWEYQNHEPTCDCFFCDDAEIIRDWRHWYITPNRFPYDTVAEIHHLLAPFNHVAGHEEMTREVQRELKMILLTLNEERFYDCRMENFSVGKSQPQHYHLHLIKWKRV